MTIKIGSVEFQVTLMNPEKPIEQITLEDLRGATVSIFAPALRAPPPPTTQPPLIQPKALSDDLALLQGIDFSNFTISMIAKRLFKVDIANKKFDQGFPSLKPRVLAWPERSLEKENIWAVFLAEISVATWEKHVFAVGINRENQQVILGFAPSEAELYKSLKKRKLNLKNVEFGMLSIKLDVDLFREVFPKAKLARDWEEFIEKQPESEHRALRAAMTSPVQKDVEKIIRKYDGPKELLTYFQFSPQAWRALRTANNITFKIAEEIRSHLQGKLLTPEQVNYLVVWTLLRIQYQWYRIPIDAKQFTKLVHTKPLVVVPKSDTKTHVKSKSYESAK